MMRRLRLPIPRIDGTDVLLVLGLAVALSGLYLLAGLAWVLLAAGLLVALYGAWRDVRP